jgi:hypothetical protein
MKMLEQGKPMAGEVIDVEAIKTPEPEPEPEPEPVQPEAEPALQPELEEKPKKKKKEDLKPKIEIIDGGDDTKPPSPNEIYKTFARGGGT